MTNIKIKLGKKYRDKILGAEGIATAQCKYLTGCDHVQLSWRKDDETKEDWIDIVRLELVPEPKKEKLVSANKIGGPAAHPPKRR